MPIDHNLAKQAQQAARVASYQRLIDVRAREEERLRIAKEQRIAAAVGQEPIRASRLSPGLASTAATIRR